jgi:hypothetical protein
MISRKDWPDIRLSYGSNEAAKFRLEPGDRLKLEISTESLEDLAKVRPQFVTLKVEDHPFAKLFAESAYGKPLEASIPTLIQALVDTQVPSVSGWRTFAEHKTVDLVELHGVNAFYQFTLLPHPDLANIRIRRLQEDGSEKVMEVDLTKVIAASTEQTTVEEARNADVRLQAGDVVEISLLKDQLGEPWKGFNAKEEAFFAKALDGRVQVTDAKSDITVRDLLYKAPRFVETEIGWVPLPPESGVPTVRGSWLTQGGFMEVNRGQVQSGDISSFWIFLRDGDEVRTQPVPQPRPRIVSPPR